MTNGAKKILRKDLKKYLDLLQYSTNEEDFEIYNKISNFLEILLTE